MKPRLEIFFLILIFLLAFTLRSYKLDENLFFGWEQGRDAWVVNDIIKGNKLTLLGPKTDAEGVFHGVFYYYLIAIPYFLGKGNPLVAGYFIAFFSALGASLIFFFGRKEFKLPARMASALIYAFSFQAIVFSRWLSNPPLSSFLSLIFAINLKEKFNKKSFLIALFCWGLIFHLEVIAALFLLPILIYYLLRNLKEFKLNLIIQAGFLLLAVFSSYIAFDLRHEHILTHGFLNLLKSSQATKLDILPLIKGVFLVYLKEFTLYLTPGFILAGKTLFFLGLLCVVLDRKKYISKIILLWTISPLFFLVLLKTTPMSQFLVHMGPCFCLLTASIIDKITKAKPGIFLTSVLVIFILFSNFSYFQKNIPQNNVFFQVGQYTNLGAQKKILDFIYQEAKGKEFSFDYYTIPYWLSQGWNYLFEHYGKNKYGYLPSQERTKVFFVIIEPDEFNPVYFKNWYQGWEQKSKLIKRFSVKNLTAEKRALH